MKKVFYVVALFFLIGPFFTSCREAKSTEEKMESKLEKAGEKVENAAKKLEEAGKRAKEEVKGAVKDVKEEFDGETDDN